MSILSDIAGKIKERVDAETAARGTAFAALQSAHDASISTFDAAVLSSETTIKGMITAQTNTFNNYVTDDLDNHIQPALDFVKSNVGVGVDSISEAVTEMNTKGAAIQSSINSNTTEFNDALAAHAAALGDDTDFSTGFAEGAA